MMTDLAGEMAQVLAVQGEASDPGFASAFFDRESLEAPQPL
jgi:hypothetical protein